MSIKSSVEKLKQFAFSQKTKRRFSFCFIYDQSRYGWERKVSTFQIKIGGLVNFSFFTLLTISIYFLRIWVLLPNQKKLLLLSCSKRNAQTAKLFKYQNPLKLIHAGGSSGRSSTNQISSSSRLD